MAALSMTVNMERKLAEERVAKRARSSPTGGILYAKESTPATLPRPGAGRRRGLRGAALVRLVAPQPKVIKRSGRRRTVKARTFRGASAKVRNLRRADCRRQHYLLRLPFYSTGSRLFGSRKLAGARGPRESSDACVDAREGGSLGSCSRMMCRPALARPSVAPIRRDPKYTLT
jgi:hypothetical protein